MRRLPQRQADLPPRVGYGYAAGCAQAANLSTIVARSRRMGQACSAVTHCESTASLMGIAALNPLRALKPATCAYTIAATICASCAFDTMPTCVACTSP